MNRWITSFVAAAITVGMVQGAIAQGQGKGQGKGQGQGQGQVVSECNHRANDRNLQGQDRKDFVEWCESRGARYQYDYGRYDGERNCYQKANNKGLTGEKRASFLGKCLADADVKHDGGKAPDRKKD